MNLAIIGATGNVGRKTIEVLEKSKIKIDNLYLVASEKSAGQKLKFKNNEIIAHYEKSYDLGKETTAYYAPMSALQIALIYEKQNEINKAAIYFERCLSMSDFDYERGIHQNAKSGLARILD